MSHTTLCLLSVYLSTCSSIGQFFSQELILSVGQSVGQSIGQNTAIFFRAKKLSINITRLVVRGTADRLPEASLS